MKILLINPRKGWRPALGLLYVASSLRAAGHRVKIIEFIDETFFPQKNAALWNALYKYNPEIVGLGVISWNRHVALKIISEIRSKTRDTLIICGGKDPTFKPEVYLNAGADFVVMHEGEETTVELLEFLGRHETDLSCVKGIAFKIGDETAVTEQRGPLELTNLFFPAYDLIDYDQYCGIRLGGIPGHFIRTGFIMASRGCPYRCKFCTDPIRRIYRERPVDDVIDEIKWQMKNWKMKGMVFLDDLFFHSEERVIALCERIIRDNLKLKYYAQTRVDRINPDSRILALMRRAGFMQLAMGVETGSQRMLDIMNKKNTVDQMRQAVRKVNAAGIYSYIFLIVGFPEEERKDLEITAEFIKEIKPTFVAVNTFMPMPGTEYFNEEDESNLLELSYSITENQATSRSKVPREEVVKFQNRFTSLAQKSADLNLLKYADFWLWAAGFFLLNPGLILRTLMR